MRALPGWVLPTGALATGLGLLLYLARRAAAAPVSNLPDGPADAAAPAPPAPPSPPSAPPRLKRYPPGSPEAIALFTAAAQVAKLPVAWASDPALHHILKHESGGVVGIPNYTYKGKDPAIVWAELRAGRITAASSATGLGRLTCGVPHGTGRCVAAGNVSRYYPDGLAGIGDALNEAVGMLRYIKAAYGSPACAWYCYNAAHPGKTCASTHKKCRAHKGY